MRSFLFLSVVALIFPAFLISQAADVGFGVDKQIFEFSLFPGSRASETLRILNQNENAPLPLRIGLTLWDVDEETDEIEFIQDDLETDPRQWITFDETHNNSLELLLKAGEERSVKLNVDPPKDAAPGGYFIMMRLASPPLGDEKSEGAGVYQVPEIGILFFINIEAASLDSGISGYSAEIASMKVGSEGKNSRWRDIILPRANAGVFGALFQNAEVDIKNTGIYYFKSKGNLEIKNVLGKTVFSAELPTRYMLPHKTRSLVIELFKAGSFWSDPLNLKGGMGLYSANLRLNHPELESELLEHSFSFWVFPWRLATLLAVIALFFLIILRKITKSNELVGRLRDAFYALLGKK